MMLVNAQYNVVRPKSLSNKIGEHQRRKMFECFVDCMKVGALDTILDIGVTTDRDFDDSNYLEAWYPHKSRITAVGADNAEFLESLFPGVRFVQADGRDLPFRSGAFDFIHSSAVLEHVGSRQQQIQFLREAWRVARKGVFITTPNRSFPVEFHTVLPLIHWLPLPLYRKLLVALGYEFFADEGNLNLLSVRSLARVGKAAGIERFEIGSVSLLGLPTNLMLIARKPISRASAASRADETIVV
jgi:SAM-dependent methyltransferase